MVDLGYVRIKLKGLGLMPATVIPRTCDVSKRGAALACCWGKRVQKTDDGLKRVAKQYVVNRKIDPGANAAGSLTEDLRNQRWLAFFECVHAWCLDTITS